jgi:membrane peptidoglycan carboxypeptidase
MNVIVKLFISALFSIHQYIPGDDDRYEKYFTDVRQATAEDIFPAANQTCRYLISVFVDAGLEVATGSSGNKFLSNALAGIMGGDQALDSLVGILSSGKYAEKFKEHNVNPEEVKKAIKTICSSKFSPLSFNPNERQELYDFIQSEINVLSDVHLNSLGDFNYFGSVNIFDRSGENIGTLDAIPRTWVPYDQMSPQLTLALLATEDEDFFQHRGVDSKAIARILKQMLSGDENVAGGSTVTMQLLKNMYFLNGPKSKYEELNSGTFSDLLRKVREWYWAWPFEKEHAKVLGDISAKKYVLEMYFNLVDFGPRIQGIEQASYVYFSKTTSQLDLAESAFITTLLKAPSRYSNPDNYVEYSEPRRNDYILSRAQVICADVNSKADTQFSSLPLASIYKKICSDGKEKIDLAYIAKEKEKPLPLWIRPASAPIDDYMILIKNQVSDWISKSKLDPEKKPKEISVQTTINAELQNLVFDVVRKKVDEYDGKSSSNPNSMNPANDDTGRKAQFKETDIDARVLNHINSIISKNDNKSLKYFSSIKFKNDKSINSQTIDLEDVSKYLNSQNQKAIDAFTKNPLDESIVILKDEDISKIIQDITKAVLENSKSVGDISLISFNGFDFEILSIDLFIKNKLKLSVEEQNVLLASVERTSVRNKIIINSLTRMNRIKPRDYMSVGVISENGNLVNANLEAVKLSDSHLARIKKFKFGDFFWLRPKDLNEKNPELFLLDKPKLQAAVMIMDSNTGEVLANFGGYDPLASGFNRSKDAYRQAGSTLKPWIYFNALNKGFNPQDIINNNYVRFERDGVKCRKTSTNPEGYCYYVPKNYSNSLNGNIALYQSLINSQNIGTYSLIQNPTWGPDWRSNLDDLRAFFAAIELYPSVNKEVTIILGSQEVTVEKLVSSFSFFANGSKIAQPQYIKYVADFKGQKLYELEPSYMQVPVSKPGSVFQIQTLLAEVANTGTAGNINAWVKKLSEGKYSESCYNDVIGTSKQTCFGGKTGTSNDAKDVWFIGISKNFVIGVWVGYDDPQPIGGNATGGGLALPIFKEIVEQGQSLLPKIEPFIENSMIPRDLERRIVYGRQACSRGSGASAVIYSDVNSNINNCGSNPEDTYSNNDTPAPAQNKPGSGNGCDCVALNNGMYAVNVTFDGKYYPSFVSNYRSLNDCNQRKYEIKSKSGRRVCP